MWGEERVEKAGYSMGMEEGEGMGSERGDMWGMEGEGRRRAGERGREGRREE